MRVERPAASTMAAIARAPAATGSSRGCGRVTISISRPPTPMPVMASRGTSSPASNRMSTQSNPFSLGERAQPGAPSTGRPRASADQQQIAGIDRHAEMLDAPADGLDRRRDHVAPVGDRGGAEHDDELGALAAAPRRSPWRARACSCGTRRSAMIAGAGRRQPLLRHLQGLVDHLAGEPRQHGRDHADLADAVGRDPDQRRRRAGDRERAVARRCAPPRTG